MYTVALLSAVLAVTSAFIVCPPNVCDNVKKEVLSCVGGVRQNAGWCGCTDLCAKVEGETCAITFLLGGPNADLCDDGLECRPVTLEGHDLIREGKCVKKTDDTIIAKRSTCQTACQRKSSQCQFSFVIYDGQWFAECDLEGNFLAEQCDNTKHCFCVDKYTGAVQDGSKVLGSANC